MVVRVFAFQLVRSLDWSIHEADLDLLSLMVMVKVHGSLCRLLVLLVVVLNHARDAM